MGQRRLEEHSSSGSSVDADWVQVGGRPKPLLFEDFYRRELPGLVVLARGLCGPGIAEEVAQEAMLVAYRRWRHVTDLHHPEAWVRRVCANLAVSQVRRRAIEARALVRLSGRQAPTGGVELTDDEFWRQVRLLPRRQAQAVALRYVYDLSVADIAETLECSEGTVKVHLSRGRHTLAERLELATDGEA
jgi:RNA polymerase sigma-70 factor, ECF subfamily